MCGYEGALLTGSWPLPAASTKIKSWPLQDADLQHPLEKSSGWRQKIRHSVLWEKPGKTGLQIVKCFQGAIFYESKFLHLLIPRDTLMSWTNVWTWFSWTAPPQLSHFCQSLGHVSLTFLSLFFQAAVQQHIPQPTPRQCWNKLPYHSVDSSPSVNAPEVLRLLSLWDLIWETTPNDKKKKLKGDH